MTLPTEDSRDEVSVVPDNTNTDHILIDDGEEDTTVRPSELARRMAEYFRLDELPPFDPLGGNEESHLQRDDGEEDTTVRTSEEIRRRCAELRERFGEDVASPTRAPDGIHVRLTEDDPGAEVRSWTPPPPAVSDETKS